MLRQNYGRPTSYPRVYSTLRNEVNRVFDDVFSDYVGARERRPSGRRFPALNIWEEEERLYAEAEVPGLSMDDLEIMVRGNELTIRGERRHEEQEGVTYHRRERGTGTFSGTVQLPVDIDVDEVEATLENGILLVTMPKAESVRPRKIEVKALDK